jgi:hypothetical protein
MPLPAPPPVKPMSVISASPGPFTTQPMIDRLIGVLDVLQPLFQRLDGLDHVEPLPRAGRAGNDLHAAWRRPSDFRISKPTFTSSTGSADSETRIVSPMPNHSRLPRPMADFTVPTSGRRPR